MSESFSHPIRTLARPALVIDPHTSVRRVKELISTEESPLQAAVVAKEGVPVGLVLTFHMDRILTSRYGMDIYYGREVQRIMDTDPLMVDAAESIDEVAKKAMNREKSKIYDHVIVLEGGAVLGIASVQSITSALADMQKRRTEALAELNRQMQKEILDHKSTQEKLRVAKQTAEEANRFKSDFLANMSHEIRTPMNAIIGMTDIALRTKLTPKQQEYLRIVESSARSLLGLINDILDFSKIEADRLDMESIPFNLRSLLEELSDMFREKVSQTGVELVVDIGKDVPEDLLGDPLRLKQVLVNLTGNAFKFTEYGEVVVQVGLADRREEQGSESTRLHIAVRDTGIGIKKEALSRLFNAFSQADGSTTRKYGGTGLGLAISKRLVALMGGEIWVESTFGKGTTFHFTVNLPLQAEQTALSLDFPEEHTAKRILIVEDNETTGAVLCEMLARMGFAADVVPDGEEAFSLLVEADASQGPGGSGEEAAEPEAGRGAPEAGQSRYGLVLLDWLLPTMNGLEVLRRLRAGDFLLPPVVMMTAYGCENEVQQADAFEVVSFLTKPIKMRSLYNGLRLGFGLPPVAFEEGDDEVVAKFDLRHTRVLLVEDNAVNQMVAQEMLSPMGVELDVAENGEEGVRKALENDYDLVLMDVQMPVLDGFGASIRLREIGSELPIVAMTANAMVGDREKCLEAGMDDYVSKPIQRLELFTAVERWRDGRDPARREERKQVRLAREARQRERSPEEREAWSEEGASAASCSEQVPQDLGEGIVLAEEGADAVAASRRSGGLYPGLWVEEGADLLGSMRIYRKICGVFERDMGDVMDRLRGAFAVGAAEVRMVAHTLAGASGNIAAKDVSRKARELEEHAKEGNLDAARDLLDEVEARLVIALGSIRTLLEEPFEG